MRRKQKLNKERREAGGTKSKEKNRIEYGRNCQRSYFNTLNFQSGSAKSKKAWVFL